MIDTRYRWARACTLATPENRRDQNYRRASRGEFLFEPPFSKTCIRHCEAAGYRSLEENQIEA